MPGIEVYRAGGHSAGLEVYGHGDVYARDDFVYWGFGGAGLSKLAHNAGFDDTDVLADVVIDGRPRIIAGLT